MKKRLFSVAMILVMLMSLFVGCSKEETTNTAATKSEDKVTETKSDDTKAEDKVEVKELTMFGFKTASEAEVIEKLIAKFNEENADINLTYEGVANSSGYQDVLNTRLASGQADDLFFANSTNILPLQEAGYLVDLSDMEVVSNYASDITLQGKVPGLPNEKSVFAMYTNYDLLEELGLEVPKNYDEFMSVCDSVKAAGKTPIVAGSKDGSGAAIFLTAKSLYPVYKDGDAAARISALNTGDELLGDTLKPGFEMLEELISKEYMNPLELLVMNAGPDSVAEFATGDVAFMFSGNWMVKAVKNANPDLSFALEGIPVGDEPVVISNTGVIMCINSGSDNQSEAKRFLEFMLATENQNTYVAGQSAFTVLKDGTSTDVAEVAPVAALLSNGKDAPWVNASFEAFNPWSLAKEYGANVMGGASIDDAVKEMNKAIETAIKLK